MGNNWKVRKGCDCSIFQEDDLGGNTGNDGSGQSQSRRAIGLLQEQRSEVVMVTMVKVNVKGTKLMRFSDWMDVGEQRQDRDTEGTSWSYGLVPGVE